MRWLIALLAGVVISLPAFAGPKKKAAAPHRVKSEFKIKFLSYNQLVALPEKKRMAYIRDIAKLMVRMERMNSRYEVASNGMTLEELKERFAALEQWVALLPKASAEEEEYVRRPRQNNRSSGVLMWDGSQFVCGDGYEVELAIPGCLKINGATTMFSISQRESDDSYKPCGEDKEIAHPDPSAGRSMRGCMSVAGFNKLPAERRAAIESLERNPERRIWYNPVQVIRATPEWQRQLAFGTTESQGAANNSAIAGDSSAAAPGAPAASTAPAAPAAPSEGPSEVAAAPVPAAPLGMSPESAAAAAGTPPPSAATPAPAPAPAAKVEPPPEDPKVEKCMPEPLSCEEPKDDAGKKAKAEAIARFRKTAKFGDVDANMCIAGGFMSKYRTASKQAGTCEPKTIFGQALKKPAKCDPGEVMCNPALFCHTTTGKDKDGKEVKSPKWFCISKKKARDGQWTAACAAKYNDRITKKGAIKEAPDQVAEACDPTKVNLPTALKEEWDGLVNSLKEMVNVWCAGSAQDFQVLFCRECEIIKAHVYKSMQLATGSGCGPQGDASKRDDDDDDNDDDGADTTR